MKHRKSLATAVAALAIGLFLPTVHTQTAAAQSNPSAAATAALLSASAITTSGTDLIAADVAPATSTFDGASTGAHASNLEVALNGGNPSTVGSTATQTAPPNNAAPTTKVAASVPAQLAPVLTADLLTASAHALDPATNCEPGSVLSTSRSEVMNPHIINNAGGATSLVALDNPELGGAVVGATQIVVGPNGELISEAGTQLTSVFLLAGTENEIRIDVLAPGFLRATSTGSSGSVEYQHPILRVSNADDEVIGILAPEDVGGVEVLQASPLFELRLGMLDSAVNGASVDASAALVEVLLLDGAEAGLPITRGATVAVAPLSVSASAPAGGITCAAPAPAAPAVDVQPEVLSETVAKLPATGAAALPMAAVALAAIALGGLSWLESARKAR